MPHLCAVARVDARARTPFSLARRVDTRTARVYCTIYTKTPLYRLLVLLTIWWSFSCSFIITVESCVTTKRFRLFLNGLVTVSCRTEGWMFSFNSMYMYMYIVPLFVFVSRYLSPFFFCFLNDSNHAYAYPLCARNHPWI